MLKTLLIPGRINIFSYTGSGEYSYYSGFIYVKVKDQKLLKQTSVFTTACAIIKRANSSNFGNNFCSA